MAVAGPQSRATTKYDLILAATRRDEADFPDGHVARRLCMSNTSHSSLLALRKIRSRRCRPTS
jgi:hypothetical protein